jgi:hypothetical protein
MGDYIVKYYRALKANKALLEAQEEAISYIEENLTNNELEVVEVNLNG